jgi:hypothetical protein
MPDGRLECVPFPRGWKSEHLKKAIANRGLDGGVLEEVYLEDDEEGTDPDTPYMREVRTLLSAVFGQFGAQVYGGPGQRTQNRLESVSGINSLYLRGLAKVGFHYFLWTSSVLKGNEPGFEPIRKFISDGVGDWRDFVEFDAPQFLPQLKQGYVPAQTSHFFFAALSKREAVAHIQFFVGPRIPPPSRILLATDPLIVDGKIFACHQARYFAESEDRGDGHDGELIVIPAFERKIGTPS